MAGQRTPGPQGTSGSMVSLERGIAQRIQPAMAGTLGVRAGQQGNVQLAWASQKGFYVHQRVTFLVIGRHLPQDERAILAHAHVAADAKVYQGLDSTHRHAMRRPRQTTDEAQAEANRFVRAQYQRAWNAPDRKTALFEFGLALHTIQDSTSPSHSGFQLWTGEETFGEEVGHVHKEMINPGDDSQLYLATKTAWEWFIAKRLPAGNLFIFGCDGCSTGLG